MGLDIALIGVAIITYLVFKFRETAILAVMFSGPVIAANCGLHTAAGEAWYAILAVYLTIFCFLSESVKIIVLYTVMQILCFASVIEYPTQYAYVYDNFAATISLLYLLQLGISVHDGCKTSHKLTSGSTEPDRINPNRLEFTQ